MDFKQSSQQFTSTASPEAPATTTNKEQGLLYKTGFLDSLFSDINVNLVISGKSHTLKLHRIVLISNGFFNSMLTGSWKEAGASEVTIQLDDPNVSFEGCKLVFSKFYGYVPDPTSLPSSIPELTGILAAANYFGDSDTAALVITKLLAKITIKSINDIIQLVNFALEFSYERSNEILEAAFSLFCSEYGSLSVSVREKLCSGIGEEFMGKVLLSDCFYCRDEFERFGLLEEVVRYTNEKQDVVDQEAPDADYVPGFLRDPLPSIYCSDDQVPILSTTQASILDGIDLTFMSFAILLKIQSGSLIPSSKIHKANWMKNLAQTRITQHESPSNGDSSMIPTDDTAKIDASRLWREFYSKVKGTVDGERFRFGVEFSDLSAIDSGLRVYSTGIDYLGSDWVVYVQQITTEDGEVKLGCYLQRNQGTNEFVDTRAIVRAWFKIFVFVSGGSGSCYVLESRPDSFNLLQSWGWRSQKMADELRNARDGGRAVLRCCVVMGQV